MRFHARHLYHFVLTAGTLVALSCAPSGAWAQQTGASDSPQFSASAHFQMQDQGEWQGTHWDDWVALDQFLDAHPDIDAALRANPDLIYDANFMGQHGDFRSFCDDHPGIGQDVRNHPEFRDWFRFRREIGTMDRYFFSLHPEVEKELEANPKLIDDQNYLNDHPELQEFLNSHPEIRQAFDRNPVAFMNVATRIQFWMRDRFALMRMRQFFDSHPDIEKELAANPKLIDDQAYLKNRPELQDFLNSHAEVGQAFDRNPDMFMAMELRLQGGANVALMDQFLRAHPEIARQLEANPSLLTNVKYLNHHPELRNFLNNNPQIREAFVQNPSIFFNGGGQFRAGANGTDVVTMDAYLDKHRDVARDLNAYPERINDSDYLAHHKDLEAFLKKHPDVRDEFTHNPSVFMHQESTFDACAQMDDFLNNHRSVAKDLDTNPNNVKDDSYLDHHKDLKGFLAKNPGVSDQFHGNPSGFMDQERKFEANRQFDVYLSAHKSVAKDLQKNPDQVKDAKYLDHHKDLKELMDKHPELAEAANTNPSAFMQEQMQFQEQYKNQHKLEQRATTPGAE
jgi:hypothetical protein